MSRKQADGWKEIDATEDNPLVPVPHGDLWFVATCQSGGERAAVAALQRYEHVAWFPQMTLWHKFERDKRRVKMNRPVFPGYLFVSPRVESELVPLASTAADISDVALRNGLISRARRQRVVAGVTEAGQWIKWLCGDLEKSRIAAGKLRDLSDAQGHGVFIKWKNAPPPTLQAGDRVQATSGPFAGFAGIVEKSAEGRTRALLHIFGRPTPADFDTSELRKIA
jgi:transcription antitermination factor NusG